jgi:hypothetical protein
MREWRAQVNQQCARRIWFELKFAYDHYRSKDCKERYFLTIKLGNAASEMRVWESFRIEWQV